MMGNPFRDIGWVVSFTLLWRLCLGTINSLIFIDDRLVLPLIWYHLGTYIGSLTNFDMLWVFDSKIFFCYHLQLCTMQELSNLGKVALASIWFRLVLIQITTRLYKDSLTLTHPPNTNIWLVPRFRYLPSWNFFDDIYWCCVLIPRNSPNFNRNPTPVHTSPGVVVASGFSGTFTLNFDPFLGAATPSFWSPPSTAGSGGGLGVKLAIASREASSARVFASAARSAAFVACSAASNATNLQWIAAPAFSAAAYNKIQNDVNVGVLFNLL